MKKLKHEAELFKAGLLAAMKNAQERGAVESEPTDSASQKLLYVYRLLVHDKMIQSLPEDQVAEATMRHKLAIWYSKQLPEDHPGTPCTNFPTIAANRVPVASWC